MRGVYERIHREDTSRGYIATYIAHAAKPVNIQHPAYRLVVLVDYANISVVLVQQVE
jgi:hypothetical protein